MLPLEQSNGHSMSLLKLVAWPCSSTILCCLWKLEAVPSRNLGRFTKLFWKSSQKIARQSPGHTLLCTALPRPHSPLHGSSPATLSSALLLPGHTLPCTVFLLLNTGLAVHFGNPGALWRALWVVHLIHYRLLQLSIRLVDVLLQVFLWIYLFIYYLLFKVFCT